MKNSKKKYIYSKRDLKYIPFCAILFIGGIFLLIDGIISIINPYWQPVRINNLFFIYFWSILQILGGFVCFGLIYYFLGNRELKLSNWGIQYYIGNKLDLGTSWRNVTKIRSMIPLMFLAHEVINVKKKFRDENGKTQEYVYVIEYLSRKERIAAFKKMVEFASKYDIEIQDDLKYLEK